jgi:hypothetical protein
MNHQKLCEFKESHNTLHHRLGGGFPFNQTSTLINWPPNTIMKTLDSFLLTSRIR